MRRGRKLGILITLLPVLAMAGMSAHFLVGRVHSGMSRLAPVLSALASERVNGKITFRGFDISPSGILVFRDVKVTHAANGRGPLLSARRVEIRVRIGDVIFHGGDPVGSIDRVLIDTPVVHLVRERDGRWNIADLVKPQPTPQKSKFRGKIEVVSGHVTVRDLALDSSLTMTNKLGDVNGVVDLARSPIASCTMAASGDPERLGMVKMVGTYNTQAKSAQARIDAIRLDVPYWTTYPKRLRFMDVSGGSANARVDVSIKPGWSSVHYAAATRITNGAVAFRKLLSPIRSVNGYVGIEDGTVSLKLKGRLGSTPVDAEGEVIGFRNPELALELRSDRANLRELARFTKGFELLKPVSLPSNGKCRAVVLGHSRTPEVHFDLEAPSFAYNGFRATAFDGSGVYSGGTIEVLRAEARAYGGRLSATGSVRMGDSPGLTLDGSISRLELSQVPSITGRGLDTDTSGRFSLIWGKDGSTIDYTGEFSAGTCRKLRFDRGLISLVYRDHGIDIRELSTNLMGGLVAASGRVSPGGKLDLDVSGADINLAALRALYWREPTVGRAQFSGRLTGTVDDPRYSGSVTAERVMVCGVGIERITSDLDAGRSRIKVRDLTLHDYPGTVTVSGDVFNPLADSRAVKLTADVRAISIDELAQMCGHSADASGDLYANLTLVGTAERPVTSGEIWVENGRVEGLPMDTMRASLLYKNDSLTLHRLQATSGEGSLEAKGEVRRDGPVRMDFSGTHLPLDELNRFIGEYAYVQGDLDLADGLVSGTLKSPAVSARVDSQNLRVNGQAFDGLSARLLYENGRYFASDAKLSSGESEYAASNLEYSPDERAGRVNITLTRGEMEKMLAVLTGGPSSGGEGDVRSLAQSVPRPFKGRVDGTIIGSVRKPGDHIEPDLDIDGTITDAAIGVGHVDEAKIDGSWRGRLVTLKSLEARDRDTNVSMSGSIGPRKDLVLNLDAHGLDLALLNQWGKWKHNFSGVADVTIVASGTTTSPVANASIDIVDPVIGAAKFDSMRARLSAGMPANGESEGSPGTLPDQRIDIDELALVLGTHDLKASGYLPMDWRNMHVPENLPLSLHGVLDTSSLELLSGLTEAIVKGSVGGDLNGTVALGGTVKEPRLTGDLSWRDGTIRLARVNTPFQDIDLHCTLEGDLLRIDRFRGASADGGGVTASGTVKFAEMKPVLDLVAKADSLQISGRNISNAYEEDIRCKLDAALRATGSWRSPLIAGTIDVRSGTIGLPGKLPKMAKRTDEPAINPRFDIRAFLQRDVSLKTPRLRAPIFGNVAVSGSLTEPVVEGAADLAGGTIMFPTTMFRIMPGSTARIRFALSEPTAINVDLRAQTRLATVSSLGQRKRYLVTMEATGPFNKLNPHFSSSPPDLPEQRLLALVMGQHQLEQILVASTSQDRNRGFSGLFSSAIVPSVLQPIEDVIGQAFGLDEFALDMGYMEPTRLSISDHLADGLYFNYTGTLGARQDYTDNLYELKLSYRLRHGLEFSISTNERKNMGIAAEGKIRF